LQTLTGKGTLISTALTDFMPKSENLILHEGLTELQEMKRKMLRTVCFYALLFLAVATIVAVTIAIAHSPLGAEIGAFVRHEAAEHLP